MGISLPLPLMRCRHPASRIDRILQALRSGDTPVPLMEGKFIEPSNRLLSPVVPLLERSVTGLNPEEVEPVRSRYDQNNMQRPSS